MIGEFQTTGLTSRRLAFLLAGVPGLIAEAFLAGTIRQPSMVGAHAHGHCKCTDWGFTIGPLTQQN